MMTGFVLAGGQSSRMGYDKALLPIGRHRLIEIAIQRLQQHVEQLFVIGNARNTEKLHTFLREDRLLVDGVLTDLQPDYGPLMGIYTGLMASETSLNLFLPCDMPWVDGRLITQLVNGYREGTETVASLHPLNGRQPFPLLCHTRACRTIGSLLNAGGRSLHALLGQPKTCFMNVEERELWRSFTNVNTIEDYARLSDDLPEFAKLQSARVKRVNP